MATTTEMRLRSADSGAPHRFNYRGTHRYLITLMTHKSEKVFTERSRVMHALDALREACWMHRFDIYAYCFLQDRLVMIARGKTKESDMKEFLGAFRNLSGAALEGELGHPLWKRKYLERVLRKTEDSNRLAREMFTLPVKEKLSTRPSEYEFLGSFVLNRRKLT